MTEIDRGNGADGRMLREREVAELLGVAVRTVRQWRWRGGGPRFRKLGAGKKCPVRYDPADVRAYLDGAARASTSDVGGAHVA